MIDEREIVRRAVEALDPPEPAFERLRRRRDRKRRNKRIAAGIVGIAVFAALVFGLARATLRGSGPVPAVPDQSPSPSIQTEGLPQIIGDDEVVVTGDRGVLQAFDRTTGERRKLKLVTCQDPCVTITGYAVSADRRWLAYEVYTCGPRASEPCEPEGGIWVTNALGEHTQLTRSCQPEACHPTIWAWSPVGATLAVFESWNAPGLFTIDPQSGERTDITNEGDVTALAWSRDGSRLAYAGSAIHVVELPTGRSTTLSDALGSVDTLAWSPDGSGLLVDSFARDHVLLTVLDTDGSDQRTLLEAAQGEGPGAPAWSPDGNRIAYATQPQKKGVTRGHFSFEVWVIGADGSDPTRIFAGECCIGDWDGPIWSPDGERVAFFDDADLSYGTWLVANADGSGEPQRIKDIEARSWAQG